MSNTGTYPPTNLWRQVEKGSRLEIINAGDFRSRDRLLEVFGLQYSTIKDSMGICDRNELSERLALSRTLMDADLREWLDEFETYGVIPTDEPGFIRFFDPSQEHNPYWKSVWQMVDRLKSCQQLPPRLRQFQQVLEQSRPLEEKERKVTSAILEQLEGMALIEGVMQLRVTMALPVPPEAKEGQPKPPEPAKIYKATEVYHTDSWTNGHTQFSAALSDIRREEYPRWTKLWYNPLVWVGIGRLKRSMMDWRYKNRQREAYQSMVVDKASPALIDDVCLGVQTILTLIQLKPEDLQGVVSRDFEVTVYLKYDKEGLGLQLVDITAAMPEVTFDFAYHAFSGYSEERIAQIEEKREVLRQEIANTRRSRDADKLRMIFNRQAGLFGATHKVQSPRTDASHRWFAISNILASNGVKDVVKEMREHRSFFGDTTRSLQMISVVIDKMVEAAHKMGAPICVPELLPEGAHVISFDSLYPVHLYGQAGVKKVIPINSLPDLGANLIGLTGHHGGGKTATEEGLLDALWYAHSGLPVLAESFRFNMKRALGAVFIERGDGSTVSMMLDKMVEVLKRCKRLNGSEVVLILDELGSATQEGDGTELGCDYLTKLMAMGISVVFSCQIRQLAEYAQNQLGAKCFQFNRKHELRPGIGDGGMKELRRDKGLDALLR